MGKFAPYFAKSSIKLLFTGPLAGSWVVLAQLKTSPLAKHATIVVFIIIVYDRTIFILGIHKWIVGSLHRSNK